LERGEECEREERGRERGARGNGASLICDTTLAVISVGEGKAEWDIGHRFLYCTGVNPEVHG